MDQKLREHIELFISCKDLRDLDTFTLSDPFVIMFVKDGEKWLEYGRTEKIDNNLNPTFAQSMTIEFLFEITQSLRFEVYHYKTNQSQEKLKPHQLQQQDQGIKRNHYLLPIYDGCNLMSGIIILRTDYVNHCPDLVTLHLKGKDLISTRLFQGPNAFLRFYRLINDNPNPVLVYETEPVTKCNNPEWLSIICTAQRLCNGDYFMPIKMELWDFESNGNHILLGETRISLNSLKNGLIDKILTNKLDPTKVVGTIQITQKFNQITTIYNFISGGLQLNLIVAIDFTDSNKEINEVTSLHYQDPKGTPSLYEQAITSVGDILINYDYDKKVPVYGFGCRTGNGFLNNCFPLNGNINDPEVFGLQGIIKVYKDIVKKLKFSGPTYLHPVIQEAMKQAKEIKDKGQDNYLILLILTDGQTIDIEITIDDIIESSKLPLSVIIIGIGDADFRNMEVLNNNDLSMVGSNDNKSKRDLVQFVPFNKYKGDTNLLSREVLKELPDQVVLYMELTNQGPKPPKVELQNQILQNQNPQLNCHP